MILLRTFFIRVSCAALFFCHGAFGFGWHYVDPQQIKKGHLGLPTSQETSPLYSFGQYIVDKGDVQAFTSVTSVVGKRNDYTTAYAHFLYGISNYCVFLTELPIAARYAYQNENSAGLGDLLLYLEYALYENDALEYSTQLTLVGQMTVPTGKSFENPPTGYGAPTYFLGATACYMGQDWYLFTCQGGRITTRNHGTKFGNFFSYNFGASRCLTGDKRFLCALTLELFGLYESKSMISGHIDHDSGGNIVFVGPSLWLATQKIFFQCGVSVAVCQQFFGHQEKEYVYPALSFGYKF